MIKYKGLGIPRINIDVEYVIYIDEIERMPKDKKDFSEWISYKTTEVGKGAHGEYYDEGDETIFVKFTVILKSLMRNA